MRKDGIQLLNNDGEPMTVEFVQIDLRLPVLACGARRMISVFAFCAGSLLATGCANRSQAPVIERSPSTAHTGPPQVTSHPAAVPGAPAVPEAPTYTVKKGDTLYFIALDHGQDYKDIAAWNNLEHPDRISVGQVLRMSPPQGAVMAGAATPGTAQVGMVAPHQAVEARPLGGATSVAPGAQTSSGAAGVVKSTPKTGKEAYSEQAANSVASPAGPVNVAGRGPDTQTAKSDAKPEDRLAEDDDKIDWGWPVHGKMLGVFSETTSKGVDIAGKVGDPVVASASGKVILAGSSLRGYGKLIIIKHNANYLSVYAHNNEILVKEGQTILKGQKIAEVGSTDAEQPMLHFEIRKLGKPVDPLKYLPSAG